MKIVGCLSDLFHGSPIFRYLGLIAATLNIICSGLYVGWPTPSLPQLLDKNSTIPTTDDEGSWIVTMLLIGGVCGSLLAAFVLDRLGRRVIILLTSIPFFASWIMIAFAKSATLLMVARFLAGISDGLIFCSAPVYLAEVAEPKIRGFIGSSVSVANLFGMFLINIIGSHLNITVTALICSIVPVLLVVIFFWMPETPYYLIMKGNLEGARNSLRFFRGHDEVDDELKRLSKAVDEQNRNTGKWLDLFTERSNRKAIYIVMVTRFGQQYSGATAILLYSQIIFGEIGDAICPETASIIYYGIQLLTSLICTVFVDKIGRRPLIIASIIGVITTLSIEGCYFYLKDNTDIKVDNYGLIPVIALIVYVIMYGAGLYTIPLLLIGEIFPTNVKAFAVSFADIYFCIIASIAIKFFQFSKDGFGLYVPFFAFAVCNIIALLIIIVFMPETKGKTLEEIQDLLKGDKKQRTHL